MQLSDVVSPEMRQILKRWAIWCRSKELDKNFQVICQSVESEYLPPAGNVYAGIEELLKPRPDPIHDYEAMEVEKAVMRLPKRHRAAIRLEFIVYKQLPLIAKLKKLGVTETEYWLLVGRGSTMVRNLLTHFPNNA